MNRQKILGEHGALDIDVLDKAGDKYATFPYITILTHSNAVVYRHPEIAIEAESIFGYVLPRPEIDEVFVATSVVSAIIRKKLERQNKRKIEDFYRMLASEDSLSRKIFDDIELGKISHERGGLLLDSVRSGDMFTDISRLNGLRMAANIALGDELLVEKLENTAKTNLSESFNTEAVAYDRVLNAFGRESPLEAAKMFAGSRPLALIGFAFPMSGQEVDSYLSVLE